MRRSLSAILVASLLAGCAHRSAPTTEPPQTPEEAQLDPRGGTSPWPLVGVGVVGVGIIAFTMLSGMAFLVTSK